MNMLARIFRGRASVRCKCSRSRSAIRSAATVAATSTRSTAGARRPLLILGSEGGTYYASESRLTKEKRSLVEAIREEARVVRESSPSRRAGRAQGAAGDLRAAACAGLGDELTRRYALGEGLPRLPHGLAPAHVLLVHRAVPWLGRPAQGAARLVRVQAGARSRVPSAQYQNREASRTATSSVRAPLAADAERRALYAWIVKGDVPSAELGSLALLRAFGGEGIRGRRRCDVRELVRTSGLPREALPSAWLKEPRVWEALLPALPMTALIATWPRSRASVCSRPRARRRRP